MVAGDEWEGVWILVVVVGFVFCSSTANNRAFGSRSVSVFSPHPQAHIHGREEGWSRAGGGSYASAPQPNPWRPVALVVVAPTSLSPSIFFNNFVVLLEDSPLLVDLGDLLMEFSIYCCLKLKEFILEMQQVQIVICPPSFAMIRSCVLSIPCLLCVTRWSKCGRSASKFLEVSMVLQERILHMRNMATFPVSCFSTQYAAAKHEARRRRDVDFGQEMVLWLEAFVWHQDCSLIYHISAVATGLLMISINWYAKLNLLFVAISEILGLIFEPVVFASQCLECQNWNKFSSVNLWIQVNMTVGDLLDNYVHTQYINFRGSKCLALEFCCFRLILKLMLPLIWSPWQLLSLFLSCTFGVAFVALAYHCQIIAMLKM